MHLAVPVSRHLNFLQSRVVTRDSAGPDPRSRIIVPDDGSPGRIQLSEALDQLHALPERADATTFHPDHLRCSGAARKAAQENCCLDRAWTDGVRAGSTDANGTDPERATVTPVGRANPTGRETGHDAGADGLNEKARRSASGKIPIIAWPCHFKPASGQVPGVSIATSN